MIKTIIKILTLNFLRLERPEGGLDSGDADTLRGLFLALLIFLCRLTGTQMSLHGGDWDSRYTEIEFRVQLSG